MGRAPALAIENAGRLPVLVETRQVAHQLDRAPVVAPGWWRLDNQRQDDLVEAPATLVHDRDDLACLAVDLQYHFLDQAWVLSPVAKMPS